MPFGGVLDDKSVPTVPGTVVLEQEAASNQIAISNARLGTGKNSHVVLEPQPSDDPNDPLNWPSWKKHLAFSTVLLGLILYPIVAATALNPGYVPISQDIGVTMFAIIDTVGDQGITMAVMAPFISAFAAKYGKRLPFVMSAVFHLVGVIVVQSTTGYVGFRAGRILEALSYSAFDTLCFTIVGDLYFVHERGFFAALVTLAFLGITSLASIVCGAIISNLGWRYMFHILIPFNVIQILFQVFACPETSYRRTQNAIVEVQFAEKLEAAPSPIEKKVLENSENTLDQEEQSTLRSKSYWQELKLVNGTFSDKNIVKLFIECLAVNLNISVLFVMLVQAWAMASMISPLYVMSAIFAMPPYQLSADGVGYLSLGMFIGSLLAFATLGFLGDKIIKFMARRNSGIYEPEYRLLLAPVGILAAVGFFVYGYITENGLSMYGASASLGVLIFGTSAIIMATSSYLIDAFEPLSDEAFISGVIMKSLLYYGTAKFIPPWVVSNGSQEVFFAWGYSIIGILCLIPVLYVFGKKYRAFWYRHNLLAKLGLK